MTHNPAEPMEFSFPLFVPASRPDRIAKARASGTDTVIVDLEDAVAPADKQQARAGLVDALREPSAVATYLRINGVDTEWYQPDIELFSSLKIDGVVLPKTEHQTQLQTLRGLLQPQQKIIALVETAVGLANVRSFAAACDRLAFGSIDYCVDLGCAHTQTALLHARSELVLAAAAAGIAPPLDGIATATGDEALIQQEAAHSAELGFAGKLLIHPAQIAPARLGFCPTPEELAWAHNLLDSISNIPADQSGAVAVEGRMIDAPVINRAQQLIKRQEALI